MRGGTLFRPLKYHETQAVEFKVSLGPSIVSGLSLVGAFRSAGSPLSVFGQRDLNDRLHYLFEHGEPGLPGRVLSDTSMERAVKLVYGFLELKNITAYTVPNGVAFVFRDLMSSYRTPVLNAGHVVSLVFSWPFDVTDPNTFDAARSHCTCTVGNILCAHKSACFLSLGVLLELAHKGASLNEVSEKWFLPLRTGQSRVVALRYFCTYQTKVSRKRDVAQDDLDSTASVAASDAEVDEPAPSYVPERKRFPGNILHNIMRTMGGESVTNYPEYRPSVGFAAKAALEQNSLTQEDEAFLFNDVFREILRLMRGSSLQDFDPGVKGEEDEEEASSDDDSDDESEDSETEAS